jgi:hypothetical protein
MMKRLSFYLTVAVALGGITVAAQYPKYLTDTPGVWKPWKGLTAIPSARKEQAAPPALVKAFEGELLALNEIAKRTPDFAPPIGFSIETWGSLDGYTPYEHAPGQPPPGGLPLMGSWTFGAFSIVEYERGGKVIRSDTGETQLQYFAINQITRDLGARGRVPEFGQVDHDAFLQPLRQGEFAGIPRYGDQLIIARDPEKLWAPLTLRSALDIVVLARSAEVQARQEVVEKATARLATLRDPKWRAEREKEDQANAPRMPDPQQFLAQTAAARSIEEDALTKELSPTGGAATGLADARRALEEVTSWIAALPPADQAAPACYAEKGTSLRARFRAVPSPGCHPLARPNYGYFDRSLPRSAPQAVLIRGYARCFDTADAYNRQANDPRPAGCRANRALVQGIDNDAIRAWIR